MVPLRNVKLKICEIDAEISLATVLIIFTLCHDILDFFENLDFLSQFQPRTL